MLRLYRKKKQYDIVVHRGSPLEKDSMIAKRIKEGGAKVHFAGWEYAPEQQAEVSKWVAEAWGFPTKGKKK